MVLPAYKDCALLIECVQGIGDPSVLSAFDIDTVVELPGVGENLQVRTSICVRSLHCFLALSYCIGSHRSPCEFFRCKKLTTHGLTSLSDFLGARRRARRFRDSRRFDAQCNICSESMGALREPPYRLSF